MDLYAITLLSAPETPLEWVLLIAAIVVAAAIVVFGIIQTIKLIKDGKLNQLKDAIVKAIKEAEKTHGGPDEKLEYAVTLVKTYCEEIGIKVNDQLIEWVVSYIKKYIVDHNDLKKIEDEGKKAVEAPKPAPKRRKK